MAFIGQSPSPRGPPPLDTRRYRRDVSLMLVRCPRHSRAARNAVRAASDGDRALDRWRYTAVSVSGYEPFTWLPAERSSARW
jgi:hypothetical protein